MLRYWDDLSVGDEITSGAVTVTESHVVGWAGLTGDWVPLHMDAEFAAVTHFGERVAHGPLTLALALGLVTQTRVFDGVLFAWLGLDEVRAVAPVRFGDTIHAVVEVEELRPSRQPERGIATFAYAVHNQRGETVMTFKSAFLMRRRCTGAVAAAAAPVAGPAAPPMEVVE